MNRLSRTAAAVTLALACVLAACDRGDESTPSPPPPVAKPRPVRPLVPAKPAEPSAVAVETFLAGGVQLPERLAAGSLRLGLRSNVEEAAFECRTTQFGAWRRDCLQGDELVVEPLADGKAYRFELRAVSAEGRVDQTPLVVAFVVDLAGGQPLGIGDATSLAPQDASELPEYLEAGAAAATAPRAVALGRFFAAVVPYGHRLSSYATDLTYNGRQKVFLAMATASAYGPPACDRSWERIVQAKDGSKYCDATPPDDELLRSYTRPLPRNHIETFRGLPQAPEEKLILAAFGDRGDEADAAEERLGVEGNCKGAQRRGSSPVPLLAKELAASASDRLDWCLVQAEGGDWWWIGGFKAQTSGGHGRLAAIYAAKSSTFGLQSSQDFVLRTVSVMRSVLAPLGESP